MIFPPRRDFFTIQLFSQDISMQFFSLFIIIIIIIIISIGLFSMDIIEVLHVLKVLLNYLFYVLNIFTWDFFLYSWKKFFLNVLLHNKIGLL